MDKPALFENYYDIDADANIEKPALMIPLGFNEQGILEQAEITDKHWQHILVAGHAGTGKSTYMHTALASLLLNYSDEQLYVWLEDCGTCEFNRFVNTAPSHIKRVNTCSDPKSYIAFVDVLEAEIDKRLKYLASVEKTSFYACCRETNKCAFPRVVVIIDGFDHFVRCLSEVNYYYTEKIEHIVRRASVCGITFVISTQEALFLAQYISQSFFELLGIRISTKQRLESYSILFGTPAAKTAHSIKLGEAITNIPSIQKIRFLCIDAQTKNLIVEHSITPTQSTI